MGQRKRSFDLEGQGHRFGSRLRRKFRVFPEKSSLLKQCGNAVLGENGMI